MKRGYFAIGIYETKEKENVGTLWRSAQNFGADFIFTIGARYRFQKTDTTKAWRNVPLFHYIDWQDFVSHIPKDAELVFIEQTEGAHKLKDFCHPKQAIYILGAEDHGIPEDIMFGHRKVEIETPMCLNVAAAGSIVLYDRSIKF